MPAAAFIPTESDKSESSPWWWSSRRRGEVRIVKGIQKTNGNSLKELGSNLILIFFMLNLPLLYTFTFYVANVMFCCYRKIEDGLKLCENVEKRMKVEFFFSSWELWQCRRCCRLLVVKGNMREFIDKRVERMWRIFVFYHSNFSCVNRFSEKIKLALEKIKFIFALRRIRMGSECDDWTDNLSRAIKKGKTQSQEEKIRCREKKKWKFKFDSWFIEFVINWQIICNFQALRIERI